MSDKKPVQVLLPPKVRMAMRIRAAQEDLNYSEYIGSLILRDKEQAESEETDNQ